MFNNQDQCPIKGDPKRTPRVSSGVKGFNDAPPITGNPTRVVDTGKVDKGDFNDKTGPIKGNG